MLKGGTCVTASTQVKGEMYYSVLRWKTRDGKWKTKWVNTGLSTSGNNKRAAEKHRIELLKEWTDKEKLRDADILFSDYLLQWMEDYKSEVSLSTYSNNIPNPR